MVINFSSFSPTLLYFLSHTLFLIKVTALEYLLLHLDVTVLLESLDLTALLEYGLNLPDNSAQCIKSQWGVSTRNPSRSATVLAFQFCTWEATMTSHVPSSVAGGYHDLKKDYKDEDWKGEKADFSQLPSGCDSLMINGQAVMESWEKPYMKALAKIATRNGGRVLEVGFGLGLSADAIQSHDIDEHIIIEVNSDVIVNLKKWATKQKHKVTAMEGLWKDQIALVEDNSLDGVLYDAYPLKEAEQHIHQFDFLKQAYKKLKPGGVITYCNLTSIGVLHTQYPDWNVLFVKTQKPHLLECGFKEDDIRPFEIFPVTPPDNCRYYHHKEALCPVLIKS